MDFEEYAVKVGFKIDKYTYGEYQFHKTQVAYDAFKAGQKSKQEEVNKLQKEVDGLKFKMQSALNTACRLQYSSGEKVYEEIKELLK